MKKTLILTAALMALLAAARAQNVHYGEYFELNSTLNASQSHEYTASDYIDLNTGFHSEPNSNNNTKLIIDPFFNNPSGYGHEVWFSPDHPAGTQGGKVGSMPMDFDVNENGAATINIPLEFPEGINGMTPHLSLDYNSQTGDGILGLGWSLGGMSKISRVPYTYLYNDSCNAVLFSDIDEWSLDGNRLRKGIDGKYYPELYDYSVLSYSSNGFTMLKKDGMVCEYKAPYYLQSGTGSLPKPIEWHISKMQDQYGNSIEFHYLNDRTNGSFYPDTIKYTCRQRLVQAYTIVFSYANRDNTPRKYFSSKDASNAYNSGYSRISKALTSIACYHDGHKVLEYVLEYANLGIWNENGLKKVKKYGYSDSGTTGEMLSSTIFDWDGTAPFLKYEMAGDSLFFQMDNNSYTWQQFALFPARFENSYYNVNPDKHGSDIVHLQKSAEEGAPHYILTIYRNTGSFLQPSGEWHYSYSFYDCYSVNQALSDGREIFAFMPADTDGDGLNEIACIYGNRNTDHIVQSLNVCLIRKTPNLNTFYIQPISIQTNQPHLFGDFAVLDFDGDGRSDLFCSHGNTIIVYLSIEGHPFNDGTRIVCGGTTSVLENNREIVIGDFYGNKKDQILVMNKMSDNTIRTKIFHGFGRSSQNSTGQFLPADPVNANLATHFFSMNDNEKKMRFHWGDFNGDGKKDALVMLNARWLLYFSKGNGQFTDPVTYSNNSIVNDSFINTISPVFQPMAHVADFDQDGCDDLSVSHFRFYRYFGPNYENLVYAGICRRDFLIKLKNDQIDVKKISILDGDGNDMIIDSLKWNIFDAIDTLPTEPGYQYYYQKPYLSCVGMYKGTSPSEILYSRLTENRGLILHVTGSLDNHPKNVISKIIDGLGATTEISYRPHTYQIPYLNSMNGSPDGERNNFEKIIPYHGFLNVVQRVKYEMNDSGNGSGKTYRETRHHFTGAKYHTQGKGFIGFVNTWRRVQGETNMKDLTTVNVYSADSNHGILLPRSNRNYHFNTSGVPVVYDSTCYQYTMVSTFPSALGNIPTGVSGGVFFPYMSTSITCRNDGSPLRYEKNVTVKNGYGNVTSSERRFGSNSSSFPYYEKHVTYYDNSITPARWIIGVPNSQTGTQRLTNNTSDQVVRHITYQNDMVYGRHLSMTIEPNSGKQLTETYGYDSFGNLDTVTRDIGNGQPRMEVTAYTSDGRFINTHTNAKGHVTRYYYHDATGLLDSVTDPNGLTTKYHYDYLCNLVKTELPSGILEEQKMMWVDHVPQSSTYHTDTPDYGAPVYFIWNKMSGEGERYTFYDQHRRKLREVSGTMDGKKVYMDYRYHNVTGLLDSVSAPYYPEENETPQFTTYQYDYLGRNTWISRPDGAFSSHSYAGQQETIQGFDGQKRKLDYNPAGLVTKVSDYGNASSSPVEIDYVRYGDGKVKTSKVGGDNATTITCTYDVNRNPATIADPSLGQLTYDYNGFGELVYSATPRDTVSYTYDVLGRMVTRNGLDGSSQWSYDQSFKGVLSQTNYFPAAGDAVTENYRYDDLGRLVWQRQRLGSQEDWEFEYGYDVLGHRNSVTYPSGKKFKWHYDRNGFMDRVTDAASNTMVWQATATDRWGNTTEFTEGNIGVAYGYDPVSGLVTGISARKNGQTLFGQACSWTSVGNLEWRTDTTLNLRETFDYDRFNRLETAYTKNLVGTTTYSSNSFGFDNNGNITQKDGVGSYTYDDAGPYALTELSPLAGTESLYEDQIATYTPFDKVGTISQEGKTLTVCYDIDRQRIVQAFSDGSTAKAKRFFTSLYETVTENGVTKKLHYLTSATGLFAIFVSTSNGGGTMYYTLKDHQGSLAAVVYGSTVERLSYDPWGRRRNTMNFGYDNVSHTFDRGYTLHEHYDEFDLINMNGRLYDPILGRMLSPDVVIQDEQNSQAYNRYSYCFNNPLRFTDPSGYVVTIPPEFEKYYMPEYLNDFDTYKKELEKLDAQNVAFNTELSEGKSVTTLTWTLGEDSYQMTIVDHGLKDYEQMCESSCVASALAAQEARFVNGNKIISEAYIMDNAKATCKQGMTVDAGLGVLLPKTNVYRRVPVYTDFLEDESHGLNYYEQRSFDEMSRNNGVFFRFFNSQMSHVMNASQAISFILNGRKEAHEIRLWDSDFNDGKIGGYKSMTEYDLKIFYGKFGTLFINKP